MNRFSPNLKAFFEVMEHHFSADISLLAMDEPAVLEVGPSFLLPFLSCAEGTNVTSSSGATVFPSSILGLESILSFLICRAPLLLLSSLRERFPRFLRVVFIFFQRRNKGNAIFLRPQSYPPPSFVAKTFKPPLLHTMSFPSTAIADLSQCCPNENLSLFFFFFSMNRRLLSPPPFF